MPPDDAYRKLTNYLLHQRKLSQETVVQHAERIAAAATATDDNAGYALTRHVGATEPMFEAAAWCAAIDVILRRRGATVAELRDFVDGHLQTASRSLVNSTSPTHNLMGVYQVMVWSKILDQFDLNGWAAR